MPPKEKTSPALVPSLLPAISEAISEEIAGRYNALRETFDRTMAGIRAERDMLTTQLRELLEKVSERSGAQTEAALAADAAGDKAAKEAARIDALAAEDQKRVDEAQAEFDRVLATDDEKALQKAAEQLHAAKTAQATGSLMQNGLRLRLNGHQAVAAQRRQEAEAAEAKWQEAWEEVRCAELKLALLDADEAMNRALAAHLRVASVMETLPRKRQPFLNGIGAVSFWFSAAHRAVRWNNMLSSDGRRDGPVAISAHTLKPLQDDVKLPAGAIVPSAE